MHPLRSIEGRGPRAELLMIEVRRSLNLVTGITLSGARVASKPSALIRVREDPGNVKSGPTRGQRHGTRGCVRCSRTRSPKAANASPGRTPSREVFEGWASAVRYRVRIPGSAGRDLHGGTTPFRSRRDNEEFECAAQTKYPNPKLNLWSLVVKVGVEGGRSIANLLSGRRDEQCRSKLKCLSDGRV